MFKWKELVTGVVHHFPSKGHVQDALLSSINHTFTIAAMFSLMKERGKTAGKQSELMACFL